MQLKTVVDRLEEIEQELEELRAEVKKTLASDGLDETELFLQKCGGWQDDRSLDQIITEIYTSRSSSLRGARLSDGQETPDA